MKKAITHMLFYKNIELIHKEEYLYADGKEWAYIGLRHRPDNEYIGIYLKYLKDYNCR